LCLRTLSTKNKTFNTTVYNKNKECSNCYMFQPLLANKRQENVNLPGWGINHRSADFVVHQLNTLNARNEFIATRHSSEDNLKFWKNDWEFGFITGNSEREIQLFRPENSKHAGLVSG